MQRHNEHNDPSFSGISMQTWDFPDFVLKNRVAKAIEQNAPGYRIFRDVRVAARVELEVLLDAIALDSAWNAQRGGSGALILDAEGVFVAVYGGRKADYCSCAFYIWADSIERAEAAKARLLEKVGSTRITEPMFSIDWNFVTRQGLDSATIEEMADDALRDRAYPEIAGGVRAFIDRYLDAPETVLVLQGPPGTGKTRLIRAILGALSARKGEHAHALYTADRQALEGDEIFVKFITGSHDAFVVEDADHVLKPRADGNEHLHRFLTIADGVVRAQGRKIIFSTNLPNVGDLDEALIRPGRCFARLHVRALTTGEALALGEEIAAGDPEKLGRVAAAFAGQRSSSLAEVYALLK